MLLDEIRELLNQYAFWLKDKTTIREIDEWIEITTPYLDRHNDYLQIYARRQNGNFLLTDDGHVTRDLEASGCNMNTPKRQELLKTTLNGFGVRENSGSIEVTASGENFSLRKHNLVQALLAVNDLFYLAEPMVESLFYEDVVGWLDAIEIRYTPNVKFTGKSGYDHLFDFVVPKSRQAPERILKAINRPSRDMTESFIHAWNDTRDVRPPNSKAYAILNDSEHVLPSGVLEALRNWGIRPVAWSLRQGAQEELAA